MTKKTVEIFRSYKQKKEKITVLTAYDYTFAKIFDKENIDALLVGDSLGMVIKGDKNTLGVTMDEIVYHTKAVAKAANQALVIADMPFLSYQTSIYDAVRNAGRLVQKAGAECVKLEGTKHLGAIKAIIKAEIPVIGHLGLTPQSILQMGKYKIQAKGNNEIQQLISDAKQLQDIGVVAIVLECIPTEVAKDISKNLQIPTIGIGAGKYCDGQVLVFQDMFNLYIEMKPKFVKTFSDIGSKVSQGVSDYIKEIKAQTFPDDIHSFHLKNDK